jgi:hypothetical protein
VKHKLLYSPNESQKQTKKLNKDAKTEASKEVKEK